MSTSEDFRTGIESLLAEIGDLLRRERDLYPLPPRDQESQQKVEEWAAEVEAVLDFHFHEQSLLDVVPVRPLELREIRDEIRKIPLVRKYRTGDADWKDCDQGLPVLQARICEMLDYLPPPNTSRSGMTESVQPPPAVPKDTPSLRKKRGPKPDMHRHYLIERAARPFGKVWRQHLV